MNTQEKIKELEAEIAKLKEQTEFKEGDWVMWEGKRPTIGRIRERCKSFDDSWQLDETYDGDGGYTSCNETLLHKATPEEIEQALIKEAKRRGYENGGRIQSWVDGSDASVGIGNKGFEYCPGSDSLALGNTWIYKSGKWAEIIEDTITVNGYNAEFKEGYVQFGCAEIENSIFTEIANFIYDEHPEIEGIGNRAVTGIKIGEGLFTLEQIKQIAERIQ